VSSQHRNRPGDPSWPSQRAWERLNDEVGGRLLRLRSPLEACRSEPDGADCAAALAALANPYHLGDEPALTQTSGWLDGWRSAVSPYAVAAAETADVVAAVNFAREHGIRVAVKGGGHSYHGTSNAADSLLIWTRRMNGIQLHEGFVPQGCAATMAPRPAVTIGAGAIWMDAYNAVTTRAGRYVQGGGCMTVGVAGIVQSGGFGSFSKAYGLAAAGLLEAEVVTADGAVRIANASTDADLFWALKGGGGGNFGVVTRLTLRTRDLPTTFGGVSGTIRARSADAFRRATTRVISLYAERLFNPHWGEQIRFKPDQTIEISMVFQGLDREQAEALWRPLVDWVSDAARDCGWETPLSAVDVPARHFWDVEYLRRHAPQRVVADDRPGGHPDSFYWAGNSEEAGQFFHAYHSVWLPASLLEPGRQDALVEALVTGSRHCGISLHFNKGLAGASEADLAAARDTAMNPLVGDAFALAVIAANGPAAFADLPGSGPDHAAARRNAADVARAARALSTVAPLPGSYVSESDFFLPDWREAFWGPNHVRLALIKKRYDPDDLFVVHYGHGNRDRADEPASPGAG
jgi:FAD/FMN-containing dehydrogenase